MLFSHDAPPSRHAIAGLVHKTKNPICILNESLEGQGKDSSKRHA